MIRAREASKDQVLLISWLTTVRLPVRLFHPQPAYEKRQGVPEAICSGEQSVRQREETVRAVQGAHKKHSQQMQERMEELKQLLTTSLKQGVQECAPPIRVHRGTQVLVAQEQATDA